MPDEDTLCVGGFVSLTSVDYPGNLAFVVFLQGCPWRCKYCHNRHLQTILTAESLPWNDVLSLIKMRSGFIDAVVFSGGEPLMQSALPEAIKEVRKLGLKVGLHTGGFSPKALTRVINSIDWVGFDLKHDFEKYQFITNVGDSGAAALESLKILLASGKDFEVRMTVEPSIPTEDIINVMNRVAELGVKTAVLQKCRDKNGEIEEHPIFSDQKVLDKFSEIFDNFLVR